MTIAAVNGSQRYSNGHRCPICRGSDRDPRGAGKRCGGYISSDGEFAHCMRDEHAGTLDKHPKSDTYPHRLHGPCACGTQHGETVYDRGNVEYVYTDRNSTPLYRVVRTPDKQFFQNRADGAGGWQKGAGVMNGVQRVLYRLPNILAYPSATVFIVEGEKDADTLHRLGLVATTNAMGAGKFGTVAACAREVLAGRRVVVIPDDDDKGRAHGDDVVAIVQSVAAEVRMLKLPAKDATAWIESGGTVDELNKLLADTPCAEPKRDPSTHDRNGDPDTSTRPETRAAPRRALTWRECVAEIYRRKDEPWVKLGIKSTTIARVRAGSFVPLVAPSGAGKSTLAIQVLREHAQNVGPAIYKTHELDGDESVGRAVGQIFDEGWADVLEGKVSEESIPDVPRFRVLERDQATLENLEREVEALKLEYPGQPILVADDYMQATPAPPGKERGFIAGISTELRRAAKRLGVVIIGVSQASTGNAKAMRSGELIGIESSSTGAETSQIERDGYVILTLGNRRIIDPHTIAWSLSIAKCRMAAADTVYDVHYRGRAGDWEVIGSALNASDVREARKTEVSSKRIDTLKRSIRDLLSTSPKPMSKRDIVGATTGNNGEIGDAIKALIRDGSVVHVGDVRHPPLWTKERAGANHEVLPAIPDAPKCSPGA